ncbi:hypothetical protein [Polyangium aurulentum]|uniref:hypothetical protein n=1 Tax=Polyangium aurulentum TaxID=2567896 RepID=UPI0010ADD6CC|nr:hypothetical protein [Polyangium aurulentum]UQA60367.1 hypothetical protein E8A73_007805 [Polyangium aurulentum]
MSPRVARPALVAFALVLALLGLPRRALAWVDAHVKADDVRLSIEKDGSARVEHKIKLSISGGPLRSIDLRGVDPDAVPEPDGYVVPASEAAVNSLASAVPISTELLPPPSRAPDDGSPALSVLRVRFDADKGLSRGVYVIFLRYRTELARRGLLARDGSMARVRWTGLTWDDGLDSGARATFIVPTGATEPRVEEPAVNESEGAAPPASVLSTLRRATGRDELELMRPYAPKGEPIVWMARFDARALEVTAPRAQPITPPAAPSQGALAPDRRGLILLAGGGLFVLYALLVALKSREVARLSRAAGAEPRPLIPASVFLRSAGAGTALVAGVALQLLLPTGTVGALFVVLAAALAAHRAPVWMRASALRGPGQWLSISEEEAFARPPRPKGVWLDVSTRGGKALLFASLAALGTGVWFVSRASLYHAHLFAYDAVALLALFCTGRLAELPPDPVTVPAPLLRDVARRIRKVMRKAGEEVRIVPRIRVPEGSANADELRLTVIPRSPLPGFAGLEIGVVLAPSVGGCWQAPEILLRVQAGSPCEAAVEALAGGGRWQRGRRPNERVIAFSPRLPMARMTADLAARLALSIRAARGSETSVIRRKAQALGEKAA